MLIEEGTWGNDTGATYLGCTPDTLRVWVSRRRVPFYKVGRLTRFRRQDLDEWLESNRVPVDKQRLPFERESPGRLAENTPGLELKKPEAR